VHYSACGTVQDSTVALYCIGLLRSITALYCCIVLHCTYSTVLCCIFCTALYCTTLPQAGEVGECASSLTTGVSDVLSDVGSASVNVLKGNAKLSGRLQMKVKIWAVLPVDLRFRYLFPSA